MQFSTIVISAIAVIASVHGAAIPAMDTSASSPVELEARSTNDQDSNSENTLEKRSPGYGTMGGMVSITKWDGILAFPNDNGME
ncbi:hypothetical protein BASA50_010734 [Batrachochytrium salamandrivorans]|uniref:Uncharacterized protein n=1 Tax=Batrachochytrium salamandrivorans TaxID=1357716 RepID=A0ABQ8EXN1_9FUNG|nr:hypothetical protein BASA50_010734 [Batrachochytrium salamandrivorans]